VNGGEAPACLSRSSERRPRWPCLALTNLGRWCCVVTRAPRARLARPGAGAFAIVAVLIAASIVSMFVLDVAASGWARTLPQWFTDAFEQITNFGLSGWFLYPCGFMLLCLAAVLSPALSHRAEGVVAALAVRVGFVFLAIGVPGLFVTIVKRLIGRARPYHIGDYDDPFAYMPFIWRPEYASMPSGHATTAASAAIAIGAIWPRARVAMWLYAVTIMFSRVVVLAHHPSDVIAGALVGGLGAMAVRRWFAARRLLFDADLLAFPGPSWRRIKAAAREILRGRA
jgi:membrane-associated phospholipid phosphatase